MPHRILYRCSVLFACCSAWSEVQTQHAFDGSAAIGPIEPLWHLRVRTTPQGGGVAQIRTGPIFNYDVNERATLIGGYYFTHGKNGSDWSTTHRTFGGAEVAAWETKVEVDARSLVERFSVIGGPDYTRFRNRVRVSPAHSTAPYVGAEIFLDGDGLRSTRYSAGLRRKLGETLFVDIGYFFEHRRAEAGGNRHVFGTSIHWRDKSRRLDTDR